MAKKALLDVLETTIGKYVKNLDAESLNVAVWSGKIELNRLELDIDAVNDELDRQAKDQPNLAVPFKVVGGSFDTFQVDVPWAHLMSRPVVLRARGLTVSVEPFDRLSQTNFLQAIVESEQERMKQLVQARTRSIESANELRLRRNAVAKLAQEEARQEKTSSSSSSSASSSSSSTFGSRLVRRILENMQIEIKDVHVSLKGSESTAGVVLGSLSLETTDSRGNRTFVDRTSGPQDLANSFLYKSLKIMGLGIYMDENRNPVLLRKKLTSIGEEKGPGHGQLPEHSYILSPLSFAARLRKADGNICIDYPKYRLSSELSSLSILLSKTQLEYFRDISRAIQTGEGARPLFPQYRPLRRVTKETAGEWWRYAFRCIGRINGRRLWPEFFIAFQTRKKYIPLYKRAAHHDSCHWLKKLSRQQEDEMLAIEQDRTISIEGIMAWRNIADGQFEKEQQKNDQQKINQQQTAGNTSSIFTSLFGSKPQKPNNQSVHQSPDIDDEPPITLSLEEMKELEDLSLIQSTDSDISGDSKMYDLQFVLGSFKINLTSRDMRQLVLFQMGKAATTFNASADGSYQFNLELLSLNIEDRVTPNSLFPAVLSRSKSFLPAGHNNSDTEEDPVFRLTMAKNKVQEQKLTVKLTEFQTIASPSLFVELKRFFSAPQTNLPSGSSKNNPTLEQSLSGSVDLFYDAEEGTTLKPLQEETTTTSAKVTEISNKLADAWKKKSEEKTSLVLDLDVAAPQLVIPENCVHPGANLLIFDLGHFRFRYGKVEVSKIQSWFQKNPSSHDASNGMVDLPALETGKLDINNLTFMVEKAGSWSKLSTYERRASMSGKTEVMVKNAAVVEPISISIDFGVESAVNNQATVSDDDSPPSPSTRICAIGVIPTVSLRVSPAHVSQIFVVLTTWSRLLQETRPPPVTPSSAGPTTDQPQILSSDQSPNPFKSPPSLRPQTPKVNEQSLKRLRSNVTAIFSPTASNHANFTVWHFAMSLLKLSVTLYTDIGSVDANLASVDVSVSSMSDGSSLSRLCMGWFWILDRFQYDTILRKQRLFAHSSLPKSPEEFAIDDKYEILQELEQQGIFQEGFRSSELADITFNQIGPGGSFGRDAVLPEKLVCNEFVEGEEKIDRILCAKFSSLFIHLNPNAIKTMSNLYTKFMGVLQGAAGSDLLDDNQITIVPLDHSLPKSIVAPSSPGRKRVIGDEKQVPIDPEQGTLLVKFGMRSFEVSLDSARDDLPVFAVTMANAGIDVLMSKRHDEDTSDMVVSLALGDLRIKTADIGRTLTEYRTMVGLAPGLSKSLLSVEYYSGPRAMKNSKLENIDFVTQQTTSYVNVELSPMRMVYIQAQVLALVEYINEGILGSALAAVAASSAAAASAAGQIAMQVSATAFDVLLPQSACNPNRFCLHAGEVEVNYLSLPDPGGAKVQLLLSSVLLQDTNNTKMQEDPIRMSIDVSLPLLEVGTMEDQAMRVSITISSASFILSKPQYAQLMLTIDENFGELDLFLRDDDGSSSNSMLQQSNLDEELNQPVNNSSGSKMLTHAGLVAIDNPRQMYVEVNISILSLEICNMNVSDPITRIAAVAARIDYQKFPDKLKSCIQVTLGSVVCDDRRLKAADRQYRSLMSRNTTASAPASSTTPATEGKNGTEEIFYVSYESNEDGSSFIDLKIGSTCLVLIPDAISAILDFVKVERENQQLEEVIQMVNESDGVTSEISDVGYDAIETCLSGESSAARIATMTLNVATSKCAFVLVDLGSHNPTAPNTDSVRSTTSQVTESVVLEGACSIGLLYASDKINGEMKNVELQIFGEEMEMYTAFGRERGSPVQILEPVRFSTVLSYTFGDDKAQRVDIRAAALSPLDLSFSMGNAALISAILSGFSECLKEDTSEDLENDLLPLSDQEALRIETLASELDRQDNDSTSPSSCNAPLSRQGSLVPFGRADSTDTVYSTLSLTLNATMPEAKLTFINDLQGLDEALFRIAVKNFVAGGKVTSGYRQDSVPTGGMESSLTVFAFHLNTLLLADYFDASVNLWKILLTKPWELTVKSSREKSPEKFRSRRLSTCVDIDSLPCNISFSEQFLVSLAAANRMWSIYAMATSSAVEEVEKRRLQGLQDEHLAEKGAAASAARNWITTLPYALDNHSGLHAKFSRPGSRDHFRDCANGSIQYFRFEPPRGTGYGGKRLYGQDISRTKCLRIVINDDAGSVIEIDHVDAQLGQPKRAHELGNGQMLMSYVVKEGKTIVIHLSSSIEVNNKTSIPFAFALLEGSTSHDVGICRVKNSQGINKLMDQRSLVESKGTLTKSSQNFGIPADRLNSVVRDWKSQGHAIVQLGISPQLSDSAMSSSSPTEQAIEFHGRVNLEPYRGVLEAAGGTSTSCSDVVCRPVGQPLEGGHIYAFVVQTTIEMLLINNKHLFLSIHLEPRAKIINRMPVALTVRTPMPHTYSVVSQETKGGNEIIHLLQPDCAMDIFTPGPSIAVTMKCTDMPVSGNAIGWMEGWIDLPLISEFQLWEPLKCVFPFMVEYAVARSSPASNRGSECFIVEGTNNLSELGYLQDRNRTNTASRENASEMESSSFAPPDGSLRSFCVTVCNYAVDHTGHILFEESDRSAQQPGHAIAFGTFVSPLLDRRITLLPLSNEAPVRLLQMSMDLDEGIRRSAPFCVNDISLCNGGIESTPILWDDATTCGYFAYRRLVNDHQSEIHIIPEFVVFNGSDLYQLVVRQPGAADIVIDPGKIAPVWVVSTGRGLVLSMQYTTIDCRTAPMRVDSLGLRVAVMKSIMGGNAMGSLAIQTVIGAEDSRLVVKVGEVNFGSSREKEETKSSGIFQEDFLRFRIQSSELILSLSEEQNAEYSENNVKNQCTNQEFCKVVLKRFTIDWQKIFKENSSETSNRRSVLLSPERSQLSVLVDKFQILDNTPGTPYPIVFDATSDQTNCVDLCARFRGSFDADLVKVDLFDLNLSHSNGRSERIFLSTSEDFAWKILDLIHRIGETSTELAGDAMIVKWDELHGGYVVTTGDAVSLQSPETKYQPPKSDKLYDINRARVSPFTLVLSFHRNPQRKRYKKLSGVYGAHIMNYFTRQLKFKIDKAALKFSRYEKTNLKGPPDRLFEDIAAVYTSRMKKKIITIMTAASFQDWKYLASRDDGDDEFIEGDVLRITGNLAGKTLGFVSDTVGKGLGKGVTAVTGKVGDTIEGATDKVGARVVGAGINSVVSGVGHGVGDTLTGVGSGAGKVLMGAGKGIGQVAGGVSGGVLLVGKGLGKGVVKGDAKAMVSGVTDGATAIGTGIGRGVETTVAGATEGVLTVGKGLFSGVKNVGRGIGGAFTNKRADSRRNSLQKPP